MLLLLLQLRLRPWLWRQFCAGSSSSSSRCLPIGITAMRSQSRGV